MEIQQFIDKATGEILCPTFEVTKQYLAVMQVVFDLGLPKVEKVDLNFADDIVAVYFPIEEEQFFLEIHLKKTPVIAIHFVWVQSGNNSYFNAESTDLTYEELSQCLTFRPLEGWSKGDWKKSGKSKFEFSRIMYKPIKDEAMELEKQLDLLLTELEKDPEGIIQLSKKATTYIAITRHQYVSGNTQLILDTELIQRMSKLKLSIDMFTYIVGNPIL